MTRIPTDPEQIRQLAAVMAENGLTEVELSDKDTKIRVVRGSSVLVAETKPTTQPSGMVSETASSHVGMHGTIPAPAIPDR